MYFDFVGLTGVGKTELAKSLAELLFGDENACIGSNNDNRTMEMCVLDKDFLVNGWPF